MEDARGAGEWGEDEWGNDEIPEDAEMSLVQWLQWWFKHRNGSH